MTARHTMTDAQTLPRRMSFDAERLALLPGGKFRLIGQKCGACGTVVVGKHQRCMKCHSANKEEITLTPAGTVTNYSQVHVKPSAVWKGPVPYTLVEARLPEGPIVTSYMLGADDQSSIKTGMPVKLDISKAETNEAGDDVFVYVWTPG